MARYFRITEIPFEELEKCIGDNTFEYNRTFASGDGCAYFGVNEEAVNVLMSLDKIPHTTDEIDRESTNNSKPSDCMMRCKNLGDKCDYCKDVHESKWVHDRYGIADGTCGSCMNKYKSVDAEPCVRCSSIMISHFKEEE